MGITSNSNLLYLFHPFSTIIIIDSFIRLFIRIFSTRKLFNSIIIYVIDRIKRNVK